MSKYLYFFLALTVALFAGCTTGAKLSEAEQEKLDPSLQKLVLGDPLPEKNYNITQSADGTKLYGVIITSSNPDELEKTGIVPNTISGEIVTAMITVEEIKSAVLLESVKMIKNGSKSFPN